VDLDGPDGNPQLARDLLVGEAPRGERSDLMLTASQFNHSQVHSTHEQRRDPVGGNY